MLGIGLVVVLSLAVAGLYQRVAERQESVPSGGHGLGRRRIAGHGHDCVAVPDPRAPAAGA